MNAANFRAVHRALLALMLSALFAVSALAQGSVEKVPSGPFVRVQMGQWYVDEGEMITWTVTIPNAFGTPVVVDFWDTPQSPECEPGGESRPWGPAGPVDGSGTETAPQTGLFFLDADGDGDCSESILEDGGGLVTCDAGRQQLIIQNIAVPARGSATIRFVTAIDPAVPSGDIICNWGFVYDDKDNADSGDDELINPTKDPLRPVWGCTCLNIAPPNDFDFEADKTGIAESVPLIPEDPSATILYTITGRNTGGDDVSSGTMTDVLAPGQEWVEVVDCPAPLTCTIPTPDQLVVTGWRLVGGMDPPTEESVIARARVTCDAATDDDTGEICNQGAFAIGINNIPTDDPSVGGIEDPTCFPVVFSDLTHSSKIDSYDDANGNGQLDAGEVVTFAIQAINRGSLVARSVVVTDDVGLSPCFDAGTIVPLDGGTLVGSVVTWNVGDLPAGMSSPVAVRFRVALATSEICCNQALIQSAEREECGLEPLVTNDPATSEDDDPTCTTPGPQPDLDITKTAELVLDRDASGDISAFDVIAFTVTVTNSPTASGTATGARFMDNLSICLPRLLNPLPDNLPGSMIYPNEITTTDGTDWGTDNSQPFAGLPSPGAVIIDDFGGANGIIPGETLTVKFYVRIDRLDLCCNQAMVTYNERVDAQGSDNPATPGLADDPTCFIAPPVGPDFLFDKSVETFDTNGDGFNGIGDGGRYTLELTSSGDADLVNVVITDVADSCYTVVDGTVSIEPPAAATDLSVPGSNEINIEANGPMPPADSFTVTFDVIWAEEGECCNQAVFSSVTFTDEGSNDPSDAIGQNPTCVTVANAPPAPVQLELTKTSSAAGGCADPGSTVDFRLTLESVGLGSATTWRVEDIVPAALTNVTVDPPLTWDAGTRTVSVDETTVGPMGPGAVETFTYTADVPCTPTTGTETNTAVVTYGSPARTDMSSAVVAWGVPDLTTSFKRAASFDADGNGWNDPGETVTWEIDVINTGTCPALDVVVTDQLDPLFDPALTVVPTGLLAGSTITWNSTGEPTLAALGAGASVTLSFTTEVAAGTTLGQLIENVALVEPTGHDLGACPALPALPVTRSDEMPFGEVLPFSVDLLRNAAVTSRAAALGELATAVFTGATANVATCGETELDPVRDSYAVDVAATLPTGVTVAGDGAAGGAPLVFYEASEICQPSEGGAADGLICVRKAGADVVVAQTADPASCP